MQIQIRSFWAWIGLTIITCGIYNFFFLYKFTQDINTMCANDGKDINPIFPVVLPIVTCGIYSWIYLYAVGNRLQATGHANGVNVTENGTTYLLWAIIGAFVAGIGVFVAYFLMIKNFNQLAEGYNSKIAY